MKRGKHAQVPSTVFIYAMAAVIVALILIFGYKAIGKVSEIATATDTAKFKTDIKNLIIEDTSYGKSDFVRINIPPGFEELCFVAAENAGDLSSDIKNKYPLSRDVAEAANNVFLGTLDGKIDPFFVEAFEIDGANDLCIKQQSGELRFRIEGQGDHALILSVE